MLSIKWMLVSLYSKYRYAVDVCAFGWWQAKDEHGLQATETRHTSAGLVEAKAGRLDGKPEASERRGAAAAAGLSY